MPIYSYRCPNGHIRDKLRPWSCADNSLDCQTCLANMVRVLTAHHTQPDGLYSHDPNLGDDAKFQRNLDGIERQKARIGERLDKGPPR